MNIFLDMKTLWIFGGGGGSSQNWTIFRGHFYAFKGLFLRSRSMCRMRVFFGGLLNIQIFFGVLKIPDIFGVNGRCWARAYV